MTEIGAQLLGQMQERYEQLAGMRPEDASDIGIRLQVLAQVLDDLWQELEEARRQSFAQTATGTWLEYHAAQRGLSRKPAQAAVGTAVFTRTGPTDREIVIAKGTQLSTSGAGSIRFATQEEAVIPSGEESVQVPIRCLEAGEQGNTAAGAVRVLVSAVPGVAQAVTQEPTVGGQEAEGDEELRQRLLDSYRFATNGTNSAFYYNMAMGYPGVASVKVIPRPSGSGTVEVVVDGEGVQEELLEQMRQDFAQVKELNVVVTVTQAAKKQVEIQAQVQPQDGFSASDAIEAAKGAVSRLVADLAVGQSLTTAALIKAMLDQESVANCRVLKPAADTAPSQREKICCEAPAVEEWTGGAA